MDQSFNADELDLLMLTQKRSMRQIISVPTTLNNTKKEIVQETDSSFYIKGIILDRKGKPLQKRIMTLFSDILNNIAIFDLVKITTLSPFSALAKNGWPFNLSLSNTVATVGSSSSGRA